MLGRSFDGQDTGGFVTFETHRVAGAGIQLQVRTVGTGAPLLLLHGFPDSAALWDGMTPGLLAAGHRVIAPDLRGFGASDAPPRVADYRIGTLVADVVAVLDRLCPGQAVGVVGHDWGSVVAWCLALAHPERVRALVAVSVGHPREYALGGLEQKRKGLYTMAWQARGLAERWLARNDWAGLRSWARQHPGIDDAVQLLSRPGRLTAGLNWYRANLVDVLFGDWPACRVPTLGIWSSDDRFLAEDQMRRSSRRMQAPWEYVRIDGAGHWLPLEQPQQLNERILSWLDRHRG